MTDHLVEMTVRACNGQLMYGPGRHKLRLHIGGWRYQIRLDSPVNPIDFAIVTFDVLQPIAEAMPNDSR